MDVPSELKTNDISHCTMLKFKYIEKCLEVVGDSFDYFVFIQSNMRCVKPVTIK